MTCNIARRFLLGIAWRHARAAALHTAIASTHLVDAAVCVWAALRATDTLAVVAPRSRQAWAARGGVA